MYQGYSITIKYPLAKELGWKEGDALQVDSSEGRLVISKVASPAA
jgi:bifunctional DNA-binding transcriptional regulator/antitoxin component of YhaV-PrlF toxin-antitoxin module